MRLYRGVSESRDAECNGKLRPRGRNIEVTMKIGDQHLKCDGTWDIGASEENTVRAHQFESGRHDGCLISTSRSEAIAHKFATSDNTESGFIYVIDEKLLKEYGVISYEMTYKENSHEQEVSLRSLDGGDLPDEIIIEKIRVYPK